MNKIIDQILDNYNQFNQVKKLIKTQTIQNHQFHIDQKFEIIDKGLYPFNLVQLEEDLTVQLSQLYVRIHSASKSIPIIIKNNKLKNISQP